MRRLVVVVVGVLMATLVLAGCSATDSSGNAVEAYVRPGGGAVERVREAAQHSTTIGIDGVTITDDGAGLNAPPAGLLELADAARAGHAEPELLVSNYSESVWDFSPDVATNLLSSEEHMRAVAEDIADLAAQSGMAGVQIDLESMRARDRVGLVAFASLLRDAVHVRLGRGAPVSMAVMSATDGDGYRERGYDLRALAAVVDRFVIMTYEQHGTWSGPGPIGALPWTRRVVEAAVAQGVPRDRLDLGVAGYGYSWPIAQGAGPLAASTAGQLAGDRAQWSVRDGEWTATLADGQTLHWSDGRSFDVRRELARRLGLNGVAMWSLNLSPLPTA